MILLTSTLATIAARGISRLNQRRRVRTLKYIFVLINLAVRMYTIRAWRRTHSTRTIHVVHVYTSNLYRKANPELRHFKNKVLYYQYIVGKLVDLRR